MHFRSDRYQVDLDLQGGGEGREVKNGTVDGKEITWQIDSEYDGTPLTIKYTATVDVDPFGVVGNFTAASTKQDSK